MEPLEGQRQFANAGAHLKYKTVSVSIDQDEEEVEEGWDEDPSSNFSRSSISMLKSYTGDIHVISGPKKKLSSGGNTFNTVKKDTQRNTFEEDEEDLRELIAFDSSYPTANRIVPINSHVLSAPQNKSSIAKVRLSPSCQQRKTDRGDFEYERESFDADDGRGYGTGSFSAQSIPNRIAPIDHTMRRVSKDGGSPESDEILNLGPSSKELPGGVPRITEKLTFVDDDEDIVLFNIGNENTNRILPIDNHILSAPQGISAVKNSKYLLSEECPLTIKITERGGFQNDSEDEFDGDYRDSGQSFGLDALFSLQSAGRIVPLGLVPNQEVSVKSFSNKPQLSESSRVTRRHHFDDEGDDSGMMTVSNNGSTFSSPNKVFPLGDTLQAEIIASPKSKPSSKVPMAPKGEKLSPDKAIEFMILERQAMDTEYAALRRENYELKSELDKRSMRGTAAYDASDKAAEWKAETERVKAENDLLKQKLAENKGKINIISSTSFDRGGAEKNWTEEWVYDTLPPPEEEEPVSSLPAPQSSLKLSQVKRPPPIELNTSPQIKPAIVEKQTSTRSGDRPPLDILSFLWDGAPMWKVPYSSGGLPERRVICLRREPRIGSNARRVRIVDDDGYYRTEPPQGFFVSFPLTLVWYSGDDRNGRELVLNRDAHVLDGHGTPAFWRLVTNGQGAPPSETCFSVVSHTRTLDLIADSKKQAQEWMHALESIFTTLSSRVMDKAFKRDKFSFHSEDVEDDYEPSHPLPMPRPDPKNRDVESLKRQIFAAAKTGDHDLVRDILEAGISVNLMEPSRGDTPLMIACRSGNTDIVRLCLHYGAKNDPHPDFGHTALHAAVLSSQLGAARVLLEVAADSDADGIIANLSDPSGQTPLHIACENGLLTMIQLLLSHHAEVDRRDGDGRMAIHICATLGNKKCLALLLDNCSDWLDETDLHGNTALHCAAENGHLGCVKHLLESAASVTKKNSSSKTPYMIANNKGHFQVAQLILEYQNSNSIKHGRSHDSRGNLSIDLSLLNDQVSPVSVQSFPYFMKPQSVADDLTLPRPHQSSPRPTTSTNTPTASTQSTRNERRGFNTDCDNFEIDSLNSAHSNKYYNCEDEYRDSATLIHFEQESKYDGEYGMLTSRHAWTPHGEVKQLYKTTMGSPNESEDRVVEISPLEEFLLDDILWQVWQTEEGHIYYLNTNSHSQWGDPRIYGVYTEDDNTLAGDNNISPKQSPPSSPTHKTFRNPKKIGSNRLSSFDSDEDLVDIRRPVKQIPSLYRSSR